MSENTTFNVKHLDTVLDDIVKERRSQNQKWGEQNRTPVEWIAILSEEVGEASREAVDLHFSNIPKDSELRGSELRNKRISDLRNELIQVAAVAIQAVENIDRDQTTDLKTIYTLTSKV